MQSAIFIQLLPPSFKNIFKIASALTNVASSQAIIIE